MYEITNTYIHKPTHIHNTPPPHHTHIHTYIRTFEVSVCMDSIYQKLLLQFHWQHTTDCLSMYVDMSSLCYSARLYVSMCAWKRLLQRVYVCYGGNCRNGIHAIVCMYVCMYVQAHEWENHIHTTYIHTHLPVYEIPYSWKEHLDTLRNNISVPYIHTFIHIYIYIHTYMHTHIQIHIHTYIPLMCMCACMCVSRRRA